MNHLKKVFILTSIIALSACGKQNEGVIEKKMGEGKPLVRVGDSSINEGYLEMIKRVNPGVREQLEEPATRKRIIDSLVEQESFYQESVKLGLDKDQKVQEKIVLFRRAIIAQALLESETEKRAKEYYEKNKEKEFDRVQVAHLFFSSNPPYQPPSPQAKVAPEPVEEQRKKAEQEAELKAKQAYERLKKGDAWEVVLKEMTEDKGSIARGGDFGYLTRQDRRIERLEYQPLVDAAFKMKKEEYSEPIRTKEGWHILKVTEERKNQPLEEVMGMLKMKVRNEAKAALTAEIKNKIKVQYLDLSLAEQPAPVSPLPPRVPATATLPAETIPAKMAPESSAVK